MDLVLHCGAEHEGVATGTCSFGLQRFQEAVDRSVEHEAVRVVWCQGANVDFQVLCPGASGSY